MFIDIKYFKKFPMKDIEKKAEYPFIIVQTFKTLEEKGNEIDDLLEKISVDEVIFESPNFINIKGAIEDLKVTMQKCAKIIKNLSNSLKDVEVNNIL